MSFSGICSYFLYIQVLQYSVQKTFSGISSPQSFFCSAILLLMSTYKTTMSDISFLHSSFGDVFPSKYSFHSVWCFYLYSSLGNEDEYSDSPKVQLYKTLEGKLDFLWQTVPQKLYRGSDLCHFAITYVHLNRTKPSESEFIQELSRQPVVLHCCNCAKLFGVSVSSWRCPSFFSQLRFLLQKSKPM